LDTFAFAIVLIAALLHATWNSIVKSQTNQLPVIALLASSATVGSVFVIPFVPVPSPAAWPYIATSVVLIAVYYLFLAQAYRHGDLSHVYPIARGVAPLLVAVFSVTVVGEALTGQGYLAVMVIGLGIMSLALSKGINGIREKRAVFFALGTGCFTAAHTIVDGLGARLAGTPHGYVLWLLLFAGIPVTLIALCVERDETLRVFRQDWKLGLAGGLTMLASYWLVVWAFTLAPIAFVVALRETGIVFAVLIGTFILKEKLNLTRVVATIATLIGIVMIKVNG
jgi:drug/metabolite transporter (DMT)-like permease